MTVIQHDKIDTCEICSRTVIWYYILPQTRKWEMKNQLWNCLFCKILMIYSVRCWYVLPLQHSNMICLIPLHWRTVCDEYFWMRWICLSTSVCLQGCDDGMITVLDFNFGGKRLTELNSLAMMKPTTTEMVMVGFDLRGLSWKCMSFRKGFYMPSFSISNM